MHKLTESSTKAQNSDFIKAELWFYTSSVPGYPTYPRQALIGVQSSVAGYALDTFLIHATTGLAFCAVLTMPRAGVCEKQQVPLSFSGDD